MNGRSGAKFSRTKRLLNAQDYGRVFEAPDARASHKHYLLLARINGLSNHRLGLVIAKKNVRLAVQRNRLKRIAREFFRQLPPESPTMDVVMLARKNLDTLDNIRVTTELENGWAKLMKKANALDHCDAQDTQHNGHRNTHRNYSKDKES